MRILYLVHDLNDAAVARRTAMLLEGGASVQLAGFYRGAAAPDRVGAASAVSLGRSFDAQLGKRALSVAQSLLGAGSLARKFEAPDLIIARNLEMLAIAFGLSGKFSSRPKVVYECLDVHRLMLSDGLKGQIMRRLERPLLARSALLVVSSPAFVEHYFKARQGFSGDWLLVENKTPADGAAPLTRPAIAGPPWRIGWFGMLRCARSLKILSDIVAMSQGRVEVILAGKPAYTEFKDFDGAVAAQPGLRYLGPYKPDQIADLYGSVHFTWAIDYFEEGLNSSWLLPNRLYEGTAHGAVPIALAGVETGRWLARHDAGVLLDDPARQLPALLDALDPAAMSALSAKVGAIPVGDLSFDAQDCRSLVRALRAAAERA